MKIYAFAAVSLLSLAAFAAPASAAPVSGGRIEAVVGWDHPSLDLSDAGIDDDANDNGAVFGVGVGYDLAVGPTTAIGIDLEATTSTVNETVTDGADSAEINFGRDLYAGVRLTTSVSDSVNLYLGAGYTNQRVSATITNGFDIASDSANGDGVRGRAGLQFAIGNNAYASVEYRYSNYESDLTRHQAVGGIGFRF